MINFVDFSILIGGFLNSMIFGGGVLTSFDRPEMLGPIVLANVCWIQTNLFNY